VTGGGGDIAFISLGQKSWSKGKVSQGSIKWLEKIKVHTGTKLAKLDLMKEPCKIKGGEKKRCA